LLANLGILELRDMMAFANTRGVVTNAIMRNTIFCTYSGFSGTYIVSFKRHYIEEYCKLSKALSRGILYFENNVNGI